MERVLEIVSREILAAQTIITRFKADLEKDPAQAFYWGESSMKAAAALDVWTEIGDMHQKGWTAEMLATKLQKDALKAAKSAEFSSQVTANLMRQFRLAALSNAAEEMDYLVKYETKTAA